MNGGGTRLTWGGVGNCTPSFLPGKRQRGQLGKKKIDASSVLERQGRTKRRAPFWRGGERGEGGNNERVRQKQDSVPQWRGESFEIFDHHHQQKGSEKGGRAEPW